MESSIESANVHPSPSQSWSAQGAPPGTAPALNPAPVLNLAARSALPLLSRLATAELALSTPPADDGVPPGFGGFFPTLYTNANILLRDPLTVFIELNDRFGGGEKMLPVRFNFLGKPSLLLTNPRHINQVFKDNDHFSPSAHPDFLARFRACLGYNLISVDYEGWGLLRPRTTAFLNGRPLNEYSAVMRAVMEEDYLPSFFRLADSRMPMDVFDSMLGFSSKVVFRSFMRLGAADVPDDVHAALSQLFSLVRSYVLRPSLPLWVPSPTNNQFKRNRNVLRRLILPYIDPQKGLDTMLGSIVRAHTKRVPAAYEGRLVEYILTVLAGGSDVGTEPRARLTAAVTQVLKESQQQTVYQLGKELARVSSEWSKLEKHPLTLRPEVFEAGLETILCEGGEIDRELVLQEMVSNLIGGSETTILLMTWGLYYLSRAPDVQERLHREANADRDSIIPHIEISNLKERWGYLYNVLREILRLASPAAVFTRPVIADVTLDGYKLKKGTSVWGSQYITQRSPYVWKDPEHFIPERFEQPVPAGAFFPFTLGQRMCVGMNFAYLEAAIALATLAKYFRVECDTPELSYDMGLTFRPDRPVKLRLIRR